MRRARDIHLRHAMPGLRVSEPGRSVRRWIVLSLLLPSRPRVRKSSNEWLRRNMRWLRLPGKPDVRSGRKVQHTGVCTSMLKRNVR